MFARLMLTVTMSLVVTSSVDAGFSITVVKSSSGETTDITFNPAPLVYMDRTLTTVIATQVTTYTGYVEILSTNSGGPVRYQGIVRENVNIDGYPNINLRSLASSPVLSVDTPSNQIVRLPFEYSYTTILGFQYKFAPFDPTLTHTFHSFIESHHSGVDGTSIGNAQYLSRGFDDVHREITITYTYVTPAPTGLVTFATALPFVGFLRRLRRNT